MIFELSIHFLFYFKLLSSPIINLDFRITIIIPPVLQSPVTGQILNSLVTSDMGRFQMRFKIQKIRMAPIEMLTFPFRSYHHVTHCSLI